MINEAKISSYTPEERKLWDDTYVAAIRSGREPLQARHIAKTAVDDRRACIGIG